MSDFEQTVIKKLDDLTKMLGMAIPRSRMPRKPPAELLGVRLPDQVSNDRACELYRIFKMTCGLTPEQKYKQKFPEGTWEEAGLEIVPRAILINRCSLRKIFKPDFDAGEHTSVDNVNRTLEQIVEQGALITMDLLNTEINTGSKAICVFTPESLMKANEVMQPKPFEPLPKKNERWKAPVVEEKKHSGLHWNGPVKEHERKHTASTVDDADLSNPGEEDEPFEGFSTKKKIEL